MRWLITADQRLSEDVLGGLSNLGCLPTPGYPAIPFDDTNEVVLSVEGPNDLPRKVGGVMGISRIDPSSPVTMWREEAVADRQSKEQVQAGFSMSGW